MTACDSGRVAAAGAGVFARSMQSLAIMYPSTEPRVVALIEPVVVLLHAPMPSQQHFAKLFHLETRWLTRRHPLEKHVRDSIVEDTARDAGLTEDDKWKPKTEEDSGFELVPWRRK